MAGIVTIREVGKTYASGFQALKGVSLDIEAGEILALLGPNGAGKTTLISIVCGITSLSSGSITVDGHDVVTDYRRSRAAVGLVPQEVKLEIFETVLNTVRFSRGLFGKPRDDAYIEGLLRRLALWDKRDAPIQELSGGMMRRVLIAKALAHQPKVLFLDEPTAGVDVELRKGLWDMVRRPARPGHHHHPDHPLHRGGRGDGRPRRGDQRRAHPARRGEGAADAPHGPQAHDHRAAGAARRDPGRAGGVWPDPRRRRPHPRVRLRPRGGAHRHHPLLRDLSAAGLVLRDVQTRQDSLEDIFIGPGEERA